MCDECDVSLQECYNVDNGDIGMSDGQNSRGATELRAPAYRRQQLLLFLVEQAGGHLGKRDLQKLLFLYVQESGSAHYAFVPFHYGCYSFLAASDLDLLCKRGWLIEDAHSVRLLSRLAEHRWALQSGERQQVRQWLSKNPLRGGALVREVYVRYPYYATRSRLKERLLNSGELEHVRAAAGIEGSTENVLYTIGYEGMHFEQFANKLLKNGVRLLCDVRRNPLSRKFGFSKSTLGALLPKLGIGYEHVPELGIASEHRRKLETERDRELLFDGYNKTLPDREDALSRVLGLIERDSRIALTCFECEPRRCHRHCISDHLAEQYGVRVCHL